MQRESKEYTGTGDRPYDSFAMSEDAETQSEGVLATTAEKLKEPVERGKESAASGIESAAQMMRDKTPDSGFAAKAGEKAANSLEKTAGYLREHESSEMWQDVQEYVRQHPASALVGALAAGFILSRIVR